MFIALGNGLVVNTRFIKTLYIEQYRGYYRYYMVIDGDVERTPITLDDYNKILRLSK